MTLKAVIFDVDGTLADTEEAHRQAFNVTFEEFGLPWKWDAALYRELLSVTGGKERILHYCECFFPRFLDHPGAGKTIAFLHEQKTLRYAHLVRVGCVMPRPGVSRLVQDLRDAGIRLAIATTTSRANVDTLLATSFSGLSVGTFEIIGTGEDAAVKKPAPDIYLWTLKKLGLSPENCLAIEDSRNGLVAAHAAGLPVLITECQWTAGDDFAEAAAVLSDLGEPDRRHRVVRGQFAGIGYADAVSLRSVHAAWSVMKSVKPQGGNDADRAHE